MLNSFSGFSYETGTTLFCPVFIFLSHLEVSVPVAGRQTSTTKQQLSIFDVSFLQPPPFVVWNDCFVFSSSLLFSTNLCTMCQDVTILWYVIHCNPIPFHRPPPSHLVPTTSVLYFIPWPFTRQSKWHSLAVVSVQQNSDCPPVNGIPSKLLPLSDLYVLPSPPPPTPPPNRWSPPPSLLPLGLSRTSLKAHFRHSAKDRLKPMVFRQCPVPAKSTKGSPLSTAHC